MTAVAPPAIPQNGLDNGSPQSPEPIAEATTNGNGVVKAEPKSEHEPHQNGSDTSAANNNQHHAEAKGEVKDEPAENGDSSSDEDDDVPWSEKLLRASSEKSEESEGASSGSDDSPVKATPPKPAKKVEASSSKRKSDVAAKASSSSKKDSKKKSKYAESESEEGYSEESEDDYAPKKKKAKTVETKKAKKDTKKDSKSTKYTEPKASSSKRGKKDVKEEAESPKKRKKKEEEEEEVWKWWEEAPKAEGIKWNSLEHKGPLFAPPYEPLPKNVKFRYAGEEMKLSEPAEEVASFYAKMLDHEYTSKPVFNKNFFKDWRKTMTKEEREKIVDLNKCDFKAMQTYYMEQTEQRKAMSKEEKLKIKESKEKEAKEYGFAYIDGHKQKVGNFRIEPPGLFRGRGEHPKMGKLKKRIQPEDVIINCSKNSNVPKPPPGHKWKEVRHDNTVTWLVAWTENVLGNNKYIMLNPSSKIKGEKDYEKFETARKIKGLIGEIRKQYTDDFKAREMRLRQRAVALYFIDKLALRAGNEKDTDEAADTVGCCSLRCEHISLHEELDGQKYVVEFDFLGKDSIRYYNKVPVEKQVFKNLKIFKENKEGSDDLFDRLDTSSLNAHLKTLTPDGKLTAKVFRTYNASITLQQQLDQLTKSKDSIHDKLLSYNRANRQVAILCNHQRAVPKTHEKSMANLEAKIDEKKKQYKQLKKQLEKARGAEKEKLERQAERAKEQLKKLQIQHTDRDENKQIALGTSKLNYLDPRITVAWCKKHNVPIEKVFNKTHRDKFRWAIEMATEEYVF
ncbi:DNA binding/DNA topoisomerase type I [Aphelenchoides avenae]|nr:DNA binding/DNA topoisomerase type I [Aphelenchus avenae]